jgi:hypothetical protein
MDVHAATREDHDALMRIVALLLALATLAERAGSLSHPVRCLVLWILRPAEAVAQAFVANATQATLPAFLEIPAPESSPAGAIRLALRFRALAAALGGLLHLMARFAWPKARAGRRHLRDAGTLSAEAGSTARRAPKPNDTS